MSRPDFLTAYREQLERLVESQGAVAAMESIVGGKFAETGGLERDCLIHLGLEPLHTLVDVGCGSGRLPVQLRPYLTGQFIGTDILPDALDFARKICGRPDWEFIPCSDCVIPCADGSADFVTFFSVFTHLLDEDIFRYLREARRVVKPSGKVVFSFLDFDCDSHWSLFEKTVADGNPNRVLNKFITKPTARRLARGAGLVVDVVYDGLEKWIPAINGVDISDSRAGPTLCEFGQSVAVLRPFPESTYLTQYPDVAAAVLCGDFVSGAHHYDVCGLREGRSAEASGEGCVRIRSTGSEPSGEKHPPLLNTKSVASSGGSGKLGCCRWRKRFSPHAPRNPQLLRSSSEPSKRHRSFQR